MRDGMTGGDPQSASRPGPLEGGRYRVMELPLQTGPMAVELLSATAINRHHDRDPLVLWRVCLTAKTTLSVEHKAQRCTEYVNRALIGHNKYLAGRNLNPALDLARSMESRMDAVPRTWMLSRTTFPFGLTSSYTSALPRNSAGGKTLTASDGG